jgi:hypothetical protein
MDAAPLRGFRRRRLNRFEVMRLLTGKERYPRRSGRRPNAIRPGPHPGTIRVGRHGVQEERENGIGSGSARRTSNGERAGGPWRRVCCMR